MTGRSERTFVKPAKKIVPAIVAAKYNTPIVDKLVEGALHGFTERGIKKESIQVVWVPGAFEIPLAAKKLALSKKVDCIVCVGCVIKGETFHFDHVADAASHGILQASLETGVPMIFSVLLGDDPHILSERAGNRCNRGYEGALAALDMANLKLKMD